MIHNTFNIEKEVIDKANDYNLDAMATGGGCDYIFKQVGEKPWQCALLCNLYKDCSPDTVDEKAIVAIFIDEEWLKGVEFKFDSADNAMHFMSNMEMGVIDL